MKYNLREEIPASRKFLDNKEFDQEAFIEELELYHRDFCRFFEEGELKGALSLVSSELAIRIFVRGGFGSVLKILDSKTKEEIEGKISTDSSGLVSLVSLNGDKYSIGMNGQCLEVKDLKKPLLAFDEETGYNSNFVELFWAGLERRAKEICLSRLESRYSMTTKSQYLRDLLKIKWLKPEYLRFMIKEIEKEFGIKEKVFKLKNGKTKKGIGSQAKVIHMSLGSPVKASKDWGKDFPEEGDIFIQGGGQGIVFSKKGNYRTAFVEVFPKALSDRDKVFSTFIRGEGKDIVEAEEMAYNKLKKIKSCKNHEWDRRERTSGHAFCTQCGVFNSEALEPLTKCEVCKTPTSEYPVGDKMYCPEHYYDLEEDIACTDGSELFPLDEKKRNFRENKQLFNLLKKEVGSQKANSHWEDLEDKFIQSTATIHAEYRPLLGKPLKTKEEISQMVLDGIPGFFSEWVKNKNI